MGEQVGALTVGVLGGMGPAATALFYRRLIELTDAACDQDHLHVLIDSDPSVPDRTDEYLRGSEAPLASLVLMAARLRGAGADFLVMPCNSAHLYFDRLVSAAALPMLHIVEEVGRELIVAGHRRIVLLGTLATMRSNLYTARLAKIAEVTLPDAPQQERIHAAILQVKAGRVDDARELLAPVLEWADAQAPDAIVLGCTELPLAVEPADVKAPLVDSITALARGTIAYARGHYPPDAE